MHAFGPARQGRCAVGRAARRSGPGGVAWTPFRRFLHQCSHSKGGFHAAVTPPPARIDRVGPRRACPDAAVGAGRLRQPQQRIVEPALGLDPRAKLRLRPEGMSSEIDSGKTHSDPGFNGFPAVGLLDQIVGLVVDIDGRAGVRAAVWMTRPKPSWKLVSPIAHLTPISPALTLTPQHSVPAPLRSRVRNFIAGIVVVLLLYFAVLGIVVDGPASLHVLGIKVPRCNRPASFVDVILCAANQI